MKPLSDLDYDELLDRAADVLDVFRAPEPVPVDELRGRSRRFIDGLPELDPVEVAPEPEPVDTVELRDSAGRFLSLPELDPVEVVPEPEPDPVDYDVLRANAGQFLSGSGLLQLREQPRDAHGRFDFGEGKATDTGARAGLSADQVREALLTSMDVSRMAPDQVDTLMGELAGGPPCNLEHLQVTGAGNEHCFVEHATETARGDMPQLPETVEGLGEFRAALAAAGVRTRVGFADPRQFHATQNELDGAKVGKLYGFIREGGYKAESTLIVSREGAVLDGHHRWAAASAARMAGSKFQVKVLRVDMPIAKLLPFSQPFSGARRAMGASAATEIVAA